MGRLIKKFPNGAFLEYDNGSFDSWCIYYVSGALRKAHQTLGGAPPVAGRLSRRGGRRLSDGHAGEGHRGALRGPWILAQWPRPARQTADFYANIWSCVPRTVLNYHISLYSGGVAK